MLGSLAFYLHYWFSVGMEPLQPHQELGKPQEWNEGLVSNSPFNHSLEQLLQLLPGNYKAGTGLSLTDTSCTCPIWYKH